MDIDVKNRLAVLEKQINDLKKQDSKIMDGVEVWKKLEQNRINEIVFKNIASITEQISKKFSSWITQEVHANLSRDNIRGLIRVQLKRSIDSNEYREVIIDIVNEVLKKINRSLERELQVTKKITYSIESEIKHLGINLPLNFDDSKKIKDRISSVITDSIKNLQIKEEKLFLK